MRPEITIEGTFDSINKLQYAVRSAGGNAINLFGEYAGLQPPHSCSSHVLSEKAAVSQSHFPRE